MMSPFRNACVMGLCLAIATVVNGSSSYAQSAPAALVPPNSPQVNGQELNGKIELLTRSLEQTQTELARSRSEIEQLRAMLGEVLKRMDGGVTVAPPQAANGGAGEVAARASQTAQISLDDWDLLNARVEEQRQTKVESG